MIAPSMETTLPRRKPVYTNVTAVGGLLLLLGFVYVLSYAPVVSIKYRGENGDLLFSLRSGVSAPGPVDLLYQPVDWLIDHSPIREPLFWWADVWGKGEAFRVAYGARHLEVIDRRY